MPFPEKRYEKKGLLAPNCSWSCLKVLPTLRGTSVFPAPVCLWAKGAVRKEFLESPDFQHPGLIAGMEPKSKWSHAC